MFESKLFLDQMFCIEEKTCDFSAALCDSASGALCPPRYVPGMILRDKLRSCEIRTVLNVEPLLIERTQLR